MVKRTDSFLIIEAIVDRQKDPKGRSDVINNHQIQKERQHYFKHLNICIFIVIQYPFICVSVIELSEPTIDWGWAMRL